MFHCQSFLQKTENTDVYELLYRCMFKKSVCRIEKYSFVIKRENWKIVFFRYFVKITSLYQYLCCPPKSKPKVLFITLNYIFCKKKEEEEKLLCSDHTEE